MLHVVKLNELAAIVRSVEGLKLPQGLLAERVAVNQEENALGSRVLNEPVGEVAGGKSLARAAGHLDQSARPIHGQRFFQLANRAHLNSTETLLNEWGHAAEPGAQVRAGRFLLVLKPFGKRFRPMEGENVAATRVGIEKVGEFRFSSRALITERERPVMRFEAFGKAGAARHPLPQGGEGLNARFNRSRRTGP